MPARSTVRRCVRLRRRGIVRAGHTHFRANLLLSALREWARVAAARAKASAAADAVRSTRLARRREAVFEEWQRRAKTRLDLYASVTSLLWLPR